MQVKVHFTDNTSTEIPEEALSSMERLLSDKISKVEYLFDEASNYVNELAKRQLAEIEAREKAQREAAGLKSTVQNTGQENPATTNGHAKRGRKPKQ